MTYFDLYDTNGKLRRIQCPMTPDQMRIALGIFKTHCNEEGKEYEFNHFMNWLKKNSGIVISYAETNPPVRVDM